MRISDWSSDVCSSDLGGLKEKLLAALRGGIRTVIIPEENRKDLADIPKNVTETMKIVPVKWIDEVLDLALERPLAPKAVAEGVEEVRRKADKPSAPLDVKDRKSTRLNSSH